MKFVRLPVLLIVSLLVALPGMGQTDPRPNLLLIVADDLGYGELGCQGNSSIPTPQIDSLAQNGIRFTSGYVSGCVCSPTRAGLMTGRYQQRFGHEYNPGPAQEASAQFGLPLQETAFPARLKAAGYATGLVGKWHLGYLPPYHPQQRGFDEFFGFLGGAHSYLDATGDRNNPLLRGNTPVSSIDYTTDVFGQEAAAFIERHRKGPWFLYLAFNAVHTPLQAHERYQERFKSIADPNRRAYAAMTAAMDDAIGVVLAKLAEHHLDKNTLIFFISDNGGPTSSNTSSNTPLRGFKAQMWEGGIRVPWIVQWKGHLPAGRVDDRPVIQLDLLPTALAAAGVVPQPEWQLDGVDLLPFLDGRDPSPPHETLYWRSGGQMAIRRGDWKLVKTFNREGEDSADDASTARLYHLTADKGETHNLATQHPEKVEALLGTWQNWETELAEPRWGPQGGKGEKRRSGKNKDKGNP